MYEIDRLCEPGYRGRGYSNGVLVGMDIHQSLR